MNSQSTLMRAMQSGNLIPDLVLGAKSLALTLAAGVGSAPIPASAHTVGVRTVSSVAVRVGLEAPEADGTASGVTTADTDFKKGIPILDAAVWVWFALGPGSQTLYLKGGTTDVVEICFM
jgi:hypothetical protein